MAKLHDYYKDEVVKKLMTEFNYNSVMQVPRVEKITLNMGVGEAIADKKLLDNAAADLAAISGQKPLGTRRTAAPHGCSGPGTRRGSRPAFQRADLSK
ncbi:50S ribosomal protein L5, partial [Streptomyces sp. NPDC088196]|uniref:50S ribosomal protein L5 n=1 Tax=Streptomyces sp. NPDC088196 TaxID=3154868 RepID=UPI00344F989F